MECWIDSGMDGYVMKQVEKKRPGRLQAGGVQVFTVKFSTCSYIFEHFNNKILRKMLGPSGY